MWEWVLVIVGLLTALYWYLTWNYDYWQSKGVYTPPGVLPGVGHAGSTITFKKSSTWLFNEMYFQLRGHPAVGIYLYRQPALLVRDLSLAQTVLVSDFSSFHDNGLDHDETIDPYLSKNPFILTGEKWKNIRHKLAPALTPSRVKAMFPGIERICKEFINYIDKRSDDNIDIGSITGFFTSEVTAQCAFGVVGNVFNDENAEFNRQAKKLWDDVLGNPYFMILFFFPALNKIFAKKFFSDELIAFFKNLINQSLEYRNANPDKVPDDYLQYLFNLRKKDPEFTIDDVVAQSLTFFTDGSGTSSMIASFLTYELTVNPDIQEQLRQDLQAMDSFSYDCIISLPLLDRVFNETMRKYSVFALTKFCTNDTVLKIDGLSFPVKKGQSVHIPVYAIQHDPDIYPDPDKFDPDRFLPENVKLRHPLSFMSFGAGPRTCIGNKIATLQVKAMVSCIVLNYKLLKCERTPEKINLDKAQFFPSPVKGIFVKFEKL